MLLGSAVSQAQFSSSNVTLYKQYTLSQMSASSGNSCWGYVSPSGREYALMGCNNKLFVVEITNPANPSVVGSISHINSTWADIKTYKTACYLGTEASGSGVQVIDLSNIDAATNRLTLVRTIASPGRTHTLHVDNDSGFLYCCGSRDGTGTTMVFDLTDPLNPQRVGMNSLTGTNYQHETIVHTYTSGPYAGRQFMFSGGTGRGVEIWDVTNKNSVTLKRRIAYPFVGYCHQGWFSSDMKYFYVNDELDESDFPGQVVPSRTLVFDISVLETADLVGTFTTGKNSIDHNLYWKNDFIFEGNYATGLNIFDATQNPLAPVYRGFFDTYPAGDTIEFVGLWSNYPFFPSGTVIGGDINRGLFIWDVSEATKTNFAVQNLTIERGRLVGGGVSELGTQDGQYLVVNKGITANPTEAPVRLVFEGTCRWQDISKVRFQLRNKVNSAGLQQIVDLWDFTAGAWVEVQNQNASTTETSFTLTAPNPDRFVEAGTKTMRARVQLKAVGPTTVSDWGTSIDLATWTINP